MCAVFLSKNILKRLNKKKKETKRVRRCYSKESSADSKIDIFDKQIEWQSAEYSFRFSTLVETYQVFRRNFADYTTKGSDTNDDDDDDSTCCYTLTACGGANLF